MGADGIICKEQDLNIRPLLKHSLVLRTRVTVFIIKPILISKKQQDAGAASKFKTENTKLMCVRFCVLSTLSTSLRNYLNTISSMSNSDKYLSMAKISCISCSKFVLSNSLRYSMSLGSLMFFL